jgi:hypothetical protein
MTVVPTDKGVMIYPDTDFEREFLEKFSDCKLQIKSKRGLSHADFIGIEIQKKAI